MALKMNLNYKGLNIIDAYIKIDNFYGNDNVTTILVAIYSSKETRDNGVPYIDLKSYCFKQNFSDTSLNIKKQGYEYLKTLDEYNGAIDLLDYGQTS